MKNTPGLTDEQLVDLLDRVLAEFRRDISVCSNEWRESHPEVTGEAAEIANTLFDLTQAVEVWRNSDLPTLIEEDEQGTHDATILMRAAPRQIGRYELRRHLGSGAMGDVYEAHDPQLERKVAVKVPRCDKMSRNQSLFTERFIREARAAAAVRHAHICPIYDAGETGGQPWVVMAYVEGQSLDAVVALGRIEDVRYAAKIVMQVAEALSAIHHHGIIHRDLKPGNILIDASGQALLTDFGLALSEMNSERITTDGLIVGTPVYMSPEQAAGENSKLTPAADIYSLGAVLYEMLTGRAPFREPMPELLRKIMLHTPTPAVELRPELDPALSAIADKALAKKPEDRFPSAAVMADALRGWLGSITSGIASPAPILAESSPRKASARPSNRVIVLLAGTLLMISASVATLFFMNGTRDSFVSIEGTSPPGAVGSSGNSASKYSAIPFRPEIPRDLTGKLTITISSNPELGPVTRSRMAATEPGALPLRTGELVHFEVQLNQPGYIYLLWVNPDGTVSPLYPWDSEHSRKGWDAPLLAESAVPRDRVMCPKSTADGFEAIEPTGLQTVVLAARRQPLTEGVDLAQLLNGLPSTPQLAMLSDTGPILRGVATGQTKSIEDPQFDALKKRLSSHFELIRVVSFPQVNASSEKDSPAASINPDHAVQTAGQTRTAAGQKKTAEQTSADIYPIRSASASRIQGAVAGATRAD